MTMKVKITDEMRDARWNCSNMDGDNLFHALIPLIAKQVMDGLQRETEEYRQRVLNLSNEARLACDLDSSNRYASAANQIFNVKTIILSQSIEVSE